MSLDSWSAASHEFSELVAVLVGHFGGGFDCIHEYLGGVFEIDLEKVAQHGHLLAVIQVVPPVALRKTGDGTDAHEIDYKLRGTPEHL